MALTKNKLITKIMEEMKFTKKAATESVEQLMEIIKSVTNPEFFYIRFHGRNAAGWRSGNMQIQFNYDYSDAELSEWVEKRIMIMADQAKAGYLLFNNHVRGQAPRNAQSMKRILRQAGFKRTIYPVFVDCA